MNNFPDHSNYSGIHLFNETKSPLPVAQKDLQQILDLIQSHEQCRFQWVEVAFVDESEIIQVNRAYLNHNYVTDVISFPYLVSQSSNAIEGTLYCCASQIRNQARENEEPPKKEFCRIIIHGLLHLCGYDDKTARDKQKMIEKENFYLNKLL